MTRFEYLAIEVNLKLKKAEYTLGTSSKTKIKFEERPFIDILNDVGGKGWELATTMIDVNPDEVIFIFKKVI